MQAGHGSPGMWGVICERLQYACFGLPSDDGGGTQDVTIWVSLIKNGVDIKWFDFMPDVEITLKYLFFCLTAI